jgi:response regulator RpfG family c-di-GMP phosphodiesterase
MGHFFTEIYVKSLLKSIQYGMLDFIEGENQPDYTSDNVTDCITLLLEFMSSMGAEIQTVDSTKNHIKYLILSLNELNDDCGQCLIETDQREDICDFIQKVITKANVEFEGDVIEEWREW